MKKHKKEHTENQDHATEAKTGAGQEFAPEDSASVIAALEAKLAEKEKEAAENYDKYLRMVAEFDNYKKRAARDKADIIKFGKEDVIKDILPFIDSLDRALEHAENNSDIQAFKEGLKLIQDQLLGCLKKHGVEKIECVGKEFDPNFHEAMMQEDSEYHDENKVINEFQCGYLLNDRLLRPARVSVCKKAGKEKNTCEQIVENGE